MASDDESEHAAASASESRAASRRGAHAKTAADRVAKDARDADKNATRAAARARDKMRASAIARARRMLGLAFVTLAVAHVARLARPTAEERAPFTHAVNIGGGPRTATLTPTAAPQAPASTAASPMAITNDWELLTPVALDLGLEGVAARAAARFRRDLLGDGPLCSVVRIAGAD